MEICLKCKKEFNKYDKPVCNECWKIICEEAKNETILEFEKQYNITNIEGKSEIFRHSMWEVEHNNYYTNLTIEKYKELLLKQFQKDYYNRLLYYKIENLKTRKNMTPNDRNWGLWYPGKHKK